jgi:VanZ like family/Concanavalin A-like lectin/glucanases superfamily
VKSIPHDRWFGWLSLVIVLGYFVVGLWPFSFLPSNRVTWLTDRSGLHFQPYGIAYDPAPLPAAAASQSPNFTVELWLEAQHEPVNDVFDILTIHNRHLPLDFSLYQWRRDLILRATTQPPQPAGSRSEAGVDDMLSERAARFITVRGDGKGTDFYLNGLAVGHFPRFAPGPEALDGQLILGNSASGKHSWTGRLFGLALYNRALDAAEIARHATLWMQGRAGQLTNTPGLTALYFFNEGSGQAAADSSAHHHHIIIPARFQPVHRELLIAPGKDIAYNRPDYSDIAVNILGFVPFGLCFFLHRRARKPKRWAVNALLAVLAGAAVSLTIEIIQAWLPNRVSSTTDLLTNTTGTLLGVVLALAIRHEVAKPESARSTP